MVLVAILNPLIALGLLAAVIVVMPGRYMSGLFLALVVGAVARGFASARRKAPPARVLSEAEDPDLFAMLNRLCALADIAMPAVLLSDQAHLNSWVVHVPGQSPRLYLTRGLREALTLEELQAVLGHELAHIANRDALVMTTVGAPAAVMLRANGGGGVDALLVIAIGLVCQLGMMILSRYRELAADVGSCAMTGRPSALASALLKVSDSVAHIPRSDLRAATALNAFNLVAVPRRGGRFSVPPLLRRVTATHPPLRTRLDALEALERAQQRPLATD